MDTRDPSKYKWSLLSSFDDSKKKLKNSTPIQVNEDSSKSPYRLETRKIVIIVFTVLAFIFIVIIVTYKVRQRIKNKNKNIYQQNISSNDELEKNIT